ncbi:hypothetical protein FOZ62_000044, partial [Perkinsus olseni]
RPREYSGGLAKPAGAQQTIANTVVAAEPRPAKQRDAAAGVEEPVETTVIRENRPSSVGDKPNSPDQAIGDSAAEASHVRPLAPAKGSKSPRRSSHDQLPPDGNNTSDSPTSNEGPEGFGREAKPAAKATSVLDLGGVLESGDDDDGVCFGPRPPGDLSPAAMGLIEDYVPGHEVIDLDDSDGEESPAMSVELRDRKSPRVKELTEEEEACLFEDAGGNAKQENTASLTEADASEGPVEEVIVIDLEGEEDAEAGRLSPRGSAYSVISSMDAADNKVDDLASSGSSSHRHHGKNSSQRKSPEDHSVGSSEVVDLRGRVSQLESELSTAKDTVRLQKEQLDKSLMEYTSALQRIVSLEKTIEAKRDVEEQNEQLQERVIELISESQDRGPSIVETKSLGPLSLEEAAMIIDAQQQPADQCSKAVVKLTDGSEVSLDDAATRIRDMEKRLSNLVLIEGPMKPGRRWYGERELQECLDAVCANQTRLEAVAPSSSFSAEACTGTDANENVSREEAPRLRRSIAELERDEGKELVDARHSTAEKDESKMYNGVKWLEGDDG